MVGSNIETRDHLWLVDMWPHVGQFRQGLDLPGEEDPCENWEIVPRTYTGLLTWAYVGRHPAPADSTRSLMLLYKEPHVYKNAPEGLLCPVGIRVQGYVDKCNLNALGNWTDESAPQTALQSILLSGSGTHQGIFGEYKAAVDEVVSFIYRTLNARAPESYRSQSDQLYATRRVFTKITAKNRDAPSALTPGDDPMGLCQNIRDHWRVLDKAQVGMFVGDAEDELGGSKVPCEPLLITEGDFVDVCIGFDIVTRRQKGSLVHQVHLTIEHILLLVAAAEIMPMDVEPQPVHVQGPGLSFSGAI
ncbi:hypothetical protein C8R44DRAFT_893565 [Mycena epipterygia]|nr:hypothetical protein C8R44DRAFT_893565 [Mycena epipterygia]